jgi:predicted RNase H-like HicB family nuclease
MTARINTETGSYRFIIRRLEEREGNGWLVEFPDVPGCISDGRTIGSAIAHGRQVLEDCLAVPPRRQSQAFSRKRRNPRGV